MRVEDAGSLSPAGDLLAFSIALILTIGILLSFEMRGSEEGPDDYRDEIKYLLESDLMDPDNDGYIDFSSDFLNGSTLNILDDDDHIVTLEDNDSRITLFIIDGIISMDVTEFEITSPVRSVTVIFERGDDLSVGILSIAGIEVVS